MNLTKRNYTYDQNGNQTEWLDKDWADSLWVNNAKYTLAYDPNGNRTENSHQDWIDNQWVNNAKINYTYDSDGNNTEQLFQYWTGSQWQNNLKINYTFDPNGNNIEKLNQTWSINQWKNNLKETYTYDTNGNRTMYLKQDWSDSLWVNEYKFTYTYKNLTVPITTSPVKYNKSFTMNLSPKGLYIQTTDQSINNSTLIIFNLQGKKIKTVKSRKYGNKFYFSWNNLKKSSAVYLITLKDNKQKIIAFRKIIVTY